MRRFFYQQIKVLKVGETLPVTDDIFHHWCKVLRANVGEQAIFFDGQGGEYTVTLTQVDKKSAEVQVENFDPINRALPYHVTIGLVMSRGERMDYAIQKMTEMGVTAIQLLTSERCEVRLKPDQIEKKLDHWQGVAIAACEQCGLNIVPLILSPLPLDNWVLQLTTNIDNLNSEQNFSKYTKQPMAQPTVLKLVLAVPHARKDGHDKSVYTTICEQFQTVSAPKFHLLIGAEGGLSAEEITQACEQGFLPWQIGERVLRTETAPVVALATLQTLALASQSKFFSSLAPL